MTQPTSHTIEVPIVTDIDQLSSANDLLLIAENNVDFGLTYPMIPLVLGPSASSMQDHRSMNNNSAPQTSQQSSATVRELGLKNGNFVAALSGGAHGDHSMPMIKDDATKTSTNIVYNYGSTSSFFN